MTSSKQDMMFLHVDAWKKSSNISQSKFAKDHGLTKSTFNYWIRKYDEIKASEISNSGFVELVPQKATPVAVLEKSCGIKKTEASSNREIEISLPGGVRITINL